MISFCVASVAALSISDSRVLNVIRARSEAMPWAWTLDTFSRAVSAFEKERYPTMARGISTAVRPPRISLEEMDCRLIFIFVLLVN